VAVYPRQKILSEVDVSEAPALFAAVTEGGGRAR
jgi:hypothetical protein